jgi:hypothetical protein
MRGGTRCAKVHDGVLLERFEVDGAKLPPARRHISGA